MTNRATGVITTLSGAARTLDGQLVNQGTVTIGATTNLFRRDALGNNVTVQHANSGTMDLSGGSLTVTMGGTLSAFTNSGTITVGAGRSFSVSNAANATFTNAATGIINGEGTVNVTGGSPTVSNLGTIAPGLSPGVLAWQGNVPMGGTSVLAIELGGTTVGTGYDQLDASGYSLTLDGTLDVQLVSGFVPNLGDQFTVLTFGARTGDFPTVNLPDLSGQGLAWDRAFSSTDMVLSVVPLPTPIVFTGDSAGGPSSGIFSVNGDGTNLTHVTTEGPPAETVVYPRWSPDRTRITYSARQPGDPNQLHIRSADGLTVFHLTSLSDTSTFKPRYSPDGKHLAFECGDGGYPNSAQDVCVIGDVTNPADGQGDGGGKVYVTDAIGSGTLGGSGAFAWNPQNPDQLAVSRDTINGQGQPGSQIFLVNFDGSGVTPLTTAPILVGGNGVYVYAMDWAPDGSFIAFEGHNIATNEHAIFRVDVSDGSVTQLSFPNPSFEAEYRPVVSPDNSEILFGLDTDGAFLVRVPAAGGQEVTVTSSFNSSLYDAGWDWSPDGSEIVHATTEWAGFGWVIAKVKSTTTSATYLADLVLVGRAGVAGEVQDRQPSWRP